MLKITRQIRYCPLILIAWDKQPKRKWLEILSILWSLTIEKNNLRQLRLKKKEEEEEEKESIVSSLSTFYHLYKMGEGHDFLGQGQGEG